jgi:hypothetical protein
MSFTKQELWERFQKYYVEFPEIGLALDVSRMNFTDDFFEHGWSLLAAQPRFVANTRNSKSNYGYHYHR